MKLRLVLFSIVVCLCFSGCSLEKVNIDKSDTEKPLSVSLHTFDKGVKGRLESVAYTYSKQNPQVNLAITASNNSDENLTDLKAMINQNATPVLFNIRGINDLKEISIPLEDLSGNVLTPSAKENLLYDTTNKDVVLGLPISLEAYGIIANRKILSELFIYPKQITSFEKLKAACEKLNGAIKSEKLSNQFPNLAAVFPPPDANAGEQAISLLNSNANYGSVHAFNSLKTLDSKSFDNLKSILAIEHKYSINKVDSRYASQEEAIASGQIAITVAGSRIINSVKEISPEVADNLVFLPVPNGRINLSVPSYWVINKNANPGQKEQAIKFLEWMYSSEEGKYQSINTMYFIPAYKGFENLPSPEALNLSAFEYIKSGKTSPLISSALPTEMTADYFDKKMHLYMAEGKSWDTVIAEIKNDYARLMNY